MPVWLWLPLLCLSPMMLACAVMAFWSWFGYRHDDRYWRRRRFYFTLNRLEDDLGYPRTPHSYAGPANPPSERKRRAGKI